MNHGVVGPRHPLPAVVAVHRPITPDDGGDKGPARQSGLQVGDETGTRLRCHVAAIGNGVDGQRHPGIGNRTGGGDQMHDMGVNPAIRRHPHQMGGAATGLEPVDKGAECRVQRKAAILHRQIDRAKVHRHHPARTDIGVADLGIAHLALGQTDIGAMSEQKVVRTGRHDPVPGRGVAQSDSIGGGVVAVTPAIHDAQNDGFGMGHGTHLAGRAGSTPGSARRQPWAVVSGQSRNLPKISEPNPVQDLTFRRCRRVFQAR